MLIFEYLLGRSITLREKELTNSKIVDDQSKTFPVNNYPETVAQPHPPRIAAVAHRAQRALCAGALGV